MKIEIKNIQKEFKTIGKESVSVLKDINLEMKDGEFFVLLGPSGCGKSTLLNIIAGLENPTGGQLIFDGEVVASENKSECMPPKERNVAMVFQTYALYPHLSVYENIAFPLKIAKMDKSEIDRQVRKSAEILHITNHIDSKPSELSGGERQRVAIARAIVRKPRVLLFDEPLSNLDAQLRTATRIELKKLQRELGITTVYVTHDQVEAMTLGDRVAVLKDGYVQQVDSAINLYEKPANKFVAGFIGFPNMNLFDVEVSKEQEKFYIQFEKDRFYFDPAAVEVGTKYCMGIRPADIEVTDDNENVLKGKIDTMELLGKEVLLYVSSNNMEFSIFTAKKNFKENQEINFRFDQSKIHFFKK
ncbi:MAG: ABC transporter ATP-binding protein [Elusimicrobiales bacterium]|nr:ABC transporter ATP-binding protein [Elusimicrobiales bacterium]